MKKFRKIVAAVMACTMLLSTTAITGCFDGSREIASIVITSGSYDASYTLNETVSFADIVITANYNDASTESISFDKVKVFLNGEDITANLNKITQSIGTKTVTIEYEGKKAVITITVSSAAGGGEIPNEPVSVVSFEKPGSYTTHLNKKEAAGKTAYVKTASDEATKQQKQDYEGEFMTGTDMYTVGDDNGFKFLPMMTISDENFQTETATAFKADTIVSLYNGTEYTALESRAAATENTVEYFSGETVYLTANVTNNTYDFADAAIGRQFKLSITPDDELYKKDSGDAFVPVVCELTVVDGFNVYTAKQLAVIDNDNLEEGAAYNSEERPGVWNDIKTAEGLMGVKPAAVVFQNDIAVTANDIPADMQYTLDKEITYYDDWDETAKTGTPVTGSNTFLYDQHDGNNFLLQRTVAEGETFKIYGNYFNLDLSNVPLVCSFGNDEGNTYEDGYGSDTSNAGWLNVIGATEEETGPQGEFEMKNLSVKGNANIGDRVYVTKSGKPLSVFAGGLVFAETAGITATIDNVVARTNFITFMPHGTNAVTTYKNTKVYDSYQNAAFIWGKNTITLENCNFERGGGPLMIAQDIDPETDLNNFPTITADEDTKLQNLVTGKEFWFNQFGASGQIASLLALDQIFGNFSRNIAPGGKMNMIMLTMPIGSGVEVISTYQAQASFTYTQGGKDYVLDRVDTRSNWMTEAPDTVGEKVRNVLAISKMGGPDGMVFNAGNSIGYMATETTPAFGYMVLTQTGVSNVDVAPNDFFTSDYISINYGGFGLLLEFFPLAQ